MVGIPVIDFLAGELLKRTNPNKYDIWCALGEALHRKWAVESSLVFWKKILAKDEQKLKSLIIINGDYYSEEREELEASIDESKYIILAKERILDHLITKIGELEK